MKDLNYMIELRKKRINIGKKSRLYGSIFYILATTIKMIVSDVTVMPVLAYLIFIYLIVLCLNNIALFFEKRELSKLLNIEKNN